MVNVPPGFCRMPKYNDHRRRTVIFITAILRRFAPIAVRAFTLLAPVILAAALFAIPASEARAHDDNSATLHAEPYRLHEAAKQGNLLVAIHFITVHMDDVNKREPSQHPFRANTPLHSAAQNGHASVVSVLLAAGASVNATNSWSQTPLHYAVERGRASIVSALLAAGANVNAGAYASKPTPLHRAVSYGRASIVSALLAAGANVNAKAYASKKTPLHSVPGTHASIALLLLDAGANINATTSYNCPSWRNSCDFGTQTKLYFAASQGHIILVSVLVAAGANVNIPATWKTNRTTYTRTPMGAAHSGGHAAIVSLLLANRGHWGKTCRREYVINPTGPEPPCSCPSETHTELETKTTTGAIRRWCEVTAICNPPSVRNARTNECDCRFPNVEAGEECEVPSETSCEKLIPPQLYDSEENKCGAQVYPCHDSAIRKDDNSGCKCPPGTFAHGDPSGGRWYRSRMRRYDGVWLYGNWRLGMPATAECHANHAPIFHDLNGWLDFIQTDNSTLILHFISDHDESPNQLAHAIQHSAHRAITILINRGANLNLADSDGDTPLHLAARKTDALENIALVSLLLDKDANPNIRNNAGWRPLDLAYHGGNSGTWQARRKIMAALINGGAQWTSECSGGAIPNENYRGLAQVATYPECKCPAHISQRDGGGACECPAHSHSQVNGRCLPQGSAEVDAEIAKMQVELARLRAALVSLNARLSLSAEAPRETVEDIAEQARETAAEIEWRRANFVALGRRAEAGEAPPPVALSDTAAECRMRGGEVRIDSGSGTRICLGLDRSGTFCLVDSDDAFPCRGLFKHVRRCNDVYHRPALNAFICGERCGADETARGRDCE